MAEAGGFSSVPGFVQVQLKGVWFPPNPFFLERRRVPKVYIREIAGAHVLNTCDYFELDARYFPLSSILKASPHAK